MWVDNRLPTAVLGMNDSASEEGEGKKEVEKGSEGDMSGKCLGSVGAGSLLLS